MYGITLTEEQQQAFAMMAAFRARTKQLEESRLVFILNGYAGTGKTTVVADFVSQFPKGTMICAPTHDAKDVLMSKVDVEVPFETVHAALGLREKINNDGTVEFSPSGFDKLGDVRLLVVDEASMIGTKLLGYLMEASYTYHLPIIFVGDAAQLPPVKEAYSPVFSEQFIKDYQAEVFSLTKIVRQAEGNPIINASMKVREMPQAIVYPEVMALLAAQENDGKGIYHLNTSTAFLHRYKDYATLNSSKILGYTNAKVAVHNKKVRAFISPDVAGSKVAIGDSIILKEPLVEGNMVLLSNNTKASVTGLETVDRNVAGIDICSYKMTIEPESIGGTFVIYTPHESAATLYKALTDELIRLAKSMPARSAMAGNAWRDYYAVKHMFTDWQHGYAMTTHRSQGSTFKHVLIDMRDIWTIQDSYVRNHLIYTALTRASETVSIIW